MLPPEPPASHRNLTPKTVDKGYCGVVSVSRCVVSVKVARLQPDFVGFGGSVAVPLSAWCRRIKGVGV